MDLLKVSKFLGVVVLFLMLVACDEHKVYDQYQTQENKAWVLEKPVVFQVDIKDALKKYNVLLNVKTDNDYLYRNLYVLTKVRLPNSTSIIDTLEYEMTDAFGNWLGEGYMDVRNNKLLFLENYEFPEKGIYQFEFSHGMRKRGEVEGISELTGITDIGLRIETNVAK